jgi:2'-5' RNA ligase
VTLAVRDLLDPGALADLVDALPVPLELGGVLLFPHARGTVVTRQVVPTTALLDLHQAVAERAGPPEARYASTAPGRWSPHVTLARRVPPALLAAVIGAIEVRPVVGEATGLRVWDASAKAVTTLR